MNAIESWKALYHAYDQALYDGPENVDHYRSAMSLYRREAALERKLAAAQRTIETLRHTLADLQLSVSDVQDWHGTRVGDALEIADHVNGEYVFESKYGKTLP